MASTDGCREQDRYTQLTPVQEVDYENLKERLLADKQVLDYARKPKVVSPKGIDPKKLEGLVTDDSRASGIDGWVKGSSLTPFVGNGYRHDNNEKKGKLAVTFSAKIPTSGKYEVRISWTPHSNRATNVPINVEHSGGMQKVHSQSARGARSWFRIPFAGNI